MLDQVESARLIQFKFIVVIFIDDKNLIKHYKYFIRLDGDQTFFMTFGHWINVKEKLAQLIHS